MKALIMLTYYNRPIFVKNALNSIIRSQEHHDDWELVFGDDSSKIPGRPIAEEILKDHLDKVKFIRSDRSVEDKIRDGIDIGSYANKIIKESDADFAVVLCDDDELFPTYLRDLSSYFTSHPEVLYCYSNVHIYNPMNQKSESVNNFSGKFNQWRESIDPVGKVDASQVAWRLSCCKEHGAWFGETTKEVTGMPWAKDTDRTFFQSLYRQCGPCCYSGLVAQYKGIHDYQLVWHKNTTSVVLKKYDEMCRELGGVKF